MWGKVCNAFLTCGDIGITPTHVGKRNLTLFRLKIFKDHPHPCGEKKLETAEAVILMGSPPPMWGKALSKYKTEAVARITPTHVGKRQQGRCDKLERWDHPHPCGEKRFYRLYPFQAEGSPPPMWGKVEKVVFPRLFVGITPTHVGKRVIIVSPLGVLEDHPHPCGEKAPFSMSKQTG